ncbi:MAG: hypothetical protein IJ352_09290 [Muribaculaceae bacterium]|nr:hypothetical protein [Muribaculaceae bacterium]
MADYIMQILQTQLMVVLSWGFNNPIALTGNRGLKFDVNGFLYQGTVEVIYNEGSDLFDVIIGMMCIEGVYFDQLVEVIDNAVERTDNYNKIVKQTYNLI